MLFEINSLSCDRSKIWPKATHCHVHAYCSLHRSFVVMKQEVLRKTASIASNSINRNAKREEEAPLPREHHIWLEILPILVPRALRFCQSPTTWPKETEGSGYENDNFRVYNGVSVIVRNLRNLKPYWIITAIARRSTNRVFKQVTLDNTPFGVRCIKLAWSDWCNSKLRN